MVLYKNYEKLEIYKADKKDTKKEVNEPKGKSFEGLYNREWHVNRLVEGDKQNTRDLDQLKCKR